MNLALLLILTTAMQYLFTGYNSVYNNENCNKNNHYSQTYLQTRPCYSNIYAQTEFWNELAFEKKSCKGSSFQFITFFQKSTNSPSSKKGKKISEYFLMEDKSTLTVLGDSNNFSTTQKLDRDIRAEWLELPADFKGTFTLFPTQEQMGYMAEFQKSFIDSLNRDSFLSNFWFGAALYLSTVENNLNLSQTGPPDSKLTIIGQISRPELKAARFAPGKHSSIGFSEIRLKAGTKFDCSNDLQVVLSSFILLPLSHKPDPTYIFDALRGFNGHPGLGTTVGFQFPLNNRCSNYNLEFFANGESIFFFKSHEYRTLDLLNKPWSRFMLFNKKNGETNIPGATALTLRVEVHPYNFVDLDAGFKVRHKDFVASLGYGLWAHASEKLRCIDKGYSDYGIAAPNGSPLTLGGIAPTASNSTIKTQAPADRDKDGNTIFEAIEEIDLDFRSGVSRSAITQKIQGSIGMIKNGKRCNVAFGLGAFVELPQNNSALENWGFWAKVAASF